MSTESQFHHLLVKDGKPAMDPHKTICVCKHKGKEVGRIPATAPNAEAYMTELARHYGELQIDYEPDPTGGLLAALHRRP